MPAPSSDVIVYNPQTNSWSAAAPLKDAVHSPGVAVLPDSGWIYVVGGGIQWYPLVGGEVYDPTTNTWWYLSDAYTDYNRVGSGVTYVAGRILVAGGTSRVYDVTTNKVESYRLRDDFCNASLRVDQVTAPPGAHLVYTLELHSSIYTIDNGAGLNFERVAAIWQRVFLPVIGR